MRDHAWRAAWGPWPLAAAPDQPLEPIPINCTPPPARREELVGVPSILRYVARAGPPTSGLYGSDALSACQVTFVKC